MRRVLVPLDGTPFAEGILADAVRLAGDRGELLLVRDANEIGYEESSGTFSYREAMGEAEAYLKDLTQRLRHASVRVPVRHMVTPDNPDAVELLTGSLHIDFLACATHGRGPIGRYFAGSGIWRMLQNRPVPVLFRHIGDRSAYKPPADTRIMVPVDAGSQSRGALPLAMGLAREHGGALWLVSVVDGERANAGNRSREPEAPTLEEKLARARAGLQDLADGLDVPTHLHVLPGPPVAELLADMARYWDVSAVVMVGPVRICADRLTAGSVADHLVGHLRCPIIVVPSLTTVGPPAHGERVAEQVFG